MLPPYLTYILTPVLCAAIGWFTNYLAVKMIFRPRRPISLLGLRIQGLMPRRQKDLAHKIGETVESKLLTHDDLREALAGPDVRRAALQIMEEQIEVFFKKNAALNPMVAMFLQGEMAVKIKKSLLGQIESALPAFIDRMVGSAGDHIDLKAIVEQKIQEFDLTTLEEIVYSIASRELKLIVVLGGVLGFLVGLVQVGLFLITGVNS